MLIDGLNLNMLRVFECVYRHKSMTRAASELHMTQSGVSQHIKKLEGLLQIELFDRVRKKPLPTEKAHHLYNVCSNHLYAIEQGLLDIKEVGQSLAGTINIGLPIEYGNNVILPLLVKWQKEHPQIMINISYGLASSLNNEIVKGELDFAIVDAFGMNKQIETRKLDEETLVLCASAEFITKNILPEHLELKDYQRLDYVDYVEGAPILKQWFNHHYSTFLSKFRMRASLMNVQGMAQMIGHGVGAGILPLHMLNKLRKLGHKIHIFEGSGAPMKNAISVASLEGRKLGPASLATMNYLLESLGQNK